MYNKQRGAASIWFVLVFVALAGFTALGIEGSRYLNDKARLGDALETSSLLLAADQAEKVLKLQGVEKQARAEESQQIVERTIHSYLRDVAEIPQTKIEIEPTPEQKAFSYRVAAMTRHNSWMHYSSAPSFDETQDVSNFAAAAKTSTGSGGGDLGDVILVVDHSMSMNENTCTEYSPNNIRRLQSAKLAVAHQLTRMFIEQVRKPGTQELDKLGRVAVIPYENATRSHMRSGQPGVINCENHLVFKDKGANSYDKFNWRNEFAALRRRGIGSPQQIANSGSVMQPFFEAALFTEGHVVPATGQKVVDWLPYNQEEVDVEATKQRILSMVNTRNTNADLPIDDFRAITMPFNRICRGNMRSIGFSDKWNQGALNKNGSFYDPFTAQVRSFTSGSFAQHAMDGQEKQYLGSWTSSFQGILRGLQEMRHHSGEKPLLFVVIAGGPDTRNADTQLERLSKDYLGQSFRQDLLTQSLIDGSNGLFAKVKAEVPHSRFVLIKFQPDDPSEQFKLNYEGAFDAVAEVKYQKASGNTMIGRCTNIDGQMNDYKFDKAEMEAMSKMVSQMLSDAGDAYGGTSEVGGLIDRRSRVKCLSR
ncbi:TadE/TadG family type IV pilus assembly protein [Vibrio europaeus]|uniref:TadE/TadG family type IV pilus assembly protein n=1 Tax=Vibrio europaeus TaxID=300876 RepID=UPI00148E2DBF|nr:hypothetical protein [Vibrio europaeus]NOH24119.1 hypothetical protein [Vibrio europaeus]